MPFSAQNAVTVIPLSFCTLICSAHYRSLISCLTVVIAVVILSPILFPPAPNLVQFTTWAILVSLIWSM